MNLPRTSGSLVRRAITTLTMAVLGTLLVTAAVHAHHRPGHGGGGGGGSGGDDGGGSTLSGTIYFEYLDAVWSMNPDGSGKQHVVSAPDPSVPAGFPSIDTHGSGHRWFATLRWADDDSDGVPDQTFPNGRPKVEILARRDDADTGCSGCTVQLADLTDVEVIDAWLSWSTDGTGSDTLVSWVGRRWTDGSPSEGGVYSVSVTWDGNGDVMGGGSPGLAVNRPMIACSCGDGELTPNISSFDWSRSGSTIVYNTHPEGPAGTRILRVYDVSSGTDNPIVAGGATVQGHGQVAVSPDETRVLFRVDSQLEHIGLDGSDRTKVVTARGKNQLFGSGVWSNDGENLLFGLYEGFGTPLDIYRSDSSGGGKTLLTDDIEGFPFAVGWR